MGTIPSVPFLCPCGFQQIREFGVGKALWGLHVYLSRLCLRQTHVNKSTEFNISAPLFLSCFFSETAFLGAENDGFSWRTKSDFAEKRQDFNTWNTVSEVLAQKLRPGNAESTSWRCAENALRPQTKIISTADEIFLHRSSGPIVLR